MIRPRGLSPAEAALWRKVASTVTPIGQHTLSQASVLGDGDASAVKVLPTATPGPDRQPPRGQPPGAPARKAGDHPARPLDRRDLERNGLDAGWERRLARGLVDPDFTLDLHGATLDTAYARLGLGLQQARTMGVRVVLLITGRARPVDAADRGHMRGAIRAKMGDWIAASEHGGAIAAIRPAHRRHGGPGALYLIMRRRRG